MSSCGDPATDEDPNAEINAAWTLFTNGNYADAITAFEALTASNPAAFAGIGWANLRLGNLAAADAAFNSAGNLADAHAGRAFVKWALGEYAATITEANAALTLSANYVFSFDTSVNKDDLRLHIAYANFHIAAYADCIAAIKILDAAYNANVSDPDIADQLLTKLEILKELYD